MHGNVYEVYLTDVSCVCVYDLASASTTITVVSTSLCSGVYNTNMLMRVMLNNGQP